VFIKPLLSIGYLLNCDWTAPELMWALPTIHCLLTVKEKNHGKSEGHFIVWREKKVPRLHPFALLI
jgi:hypothetical protein